jgi:hypothetical protein
MDKKISKILMLVVGVLALIGLALLYFSVSVDVPAEGAPGHDEAQALLDAKVGNYVSYALVLFYITAAVAVVLSLLNLLKKPALLKKALLSLGVMALLLAIAYFMSDDTMVYDAKGNIFKDGNGLPYSAGTYKWTATAIMYSIILLVIGGVMFVVDMVKNIIK